MIVDKAGQWHFNSSDLKTIKSSKISLDVPAPALDSTLVGDSSLREDTKYD